MCRGNSSMKKCFIACNFSYFQINQLLQACLIDYSAPPLPLKIYFENKVINAK